MSGWGWPDLPPDARDVAEAALRRVIPMPELVRLCRERADCRSLYAAAQAEYDATFEGRRPAAWLDDAAKALSGIAALRTAAQVLEARREAERRAKAPEVEARLQRLLAREKQEREGGCWTDGAGFGTHE